MDTEQKEPHKLCAECLKNSAHDFDAAGEDGEFKRPHPIFMMAEDVDRLNTESRQLKQQRDELLAAASVYATKYLEDEYDSVEHCIDDEHHAAVVNLFKAIAKAVSNG